MKASLNALIGGAVAAKLWDTVEVRPNAGAAWRVVPGDHLPGAAYEGYDGMKLTTLVGDDQLHLRRADFPAGLPAAGWHLRVPDGRTFKLTEPMRPVKTSAVFVWAPVKAATFE